ncbi:MAG: hypothetical protein ACTSPB_00710 [Candidatus Thorarchaeota archaeon]
MEDDSFGDLMRSRNRRDNLLGIEIEKIQELGWDFFNSIKARDYDKRNEIWRLIKTIAKQKEGLKSIQEYFGGRRIGHKKDQITDEMAIKYVFYIVQNVRGMTDDRIKPEPLVFQKKLSD